MTQAQKNYAQALAAYQIATEAKHALMAEHEHLLDTDEGIDAYTELEMAADAQVGWVAALDAKAAAERDLIEWFASILLRENAKRQVLDQAEAQKVLASHLPSIRQKVVARAMAFLN